MQLEVRAFSVPGVAVRTPEPSPCGWNLLWNILSLWIIIGLSEKKMYQMRLFILYNGPWMLLSGCHILAVPSSGRKTVKGSSVRASQMTVTHKLQLHLPVPQGPGINRPELRAKWVCFDYWDVVKLTGQEMILCWKSQFWSHKFGEVNLKAVSASLNLLCESTQLISHGLRQTANNNVVVRQ